MGEGDNFLFPKKNMGLKQRRPKKTTEERLEEYRQRITPYHKELLISWEKWWRGKNREEGKAKKRKNYHERREVEFFIKATRTFQDEIEKINRLREERNHVDHDFKINLFAMNARLATVGCEIDEKKLKIHFYDANSIFYSEKLTPHLAQRHFLYEYKDQFINPIWGVFSKDKEIQKKSEHLLKLKVLPSLMQIKHTKFYIEEIIHSWLFKFYASKNKAANEDQKSIEVYEDGMNVNYRLINPSEYVEEMKKSQGLKDLLNFSFQRQDLYIFILRSIGVGIDRVIDDQEIYLQLLENKEIDIEEVVFSSKKQITTRFFHICSFLGKEGIDHIENRENSGYRKEFFF